MELADILKKAEKDVDMAEVYIENEQSLQIDLENDNINFAKKESIKGIGIRVLKDSKIGFAYTSSPEKIDNTIQSAVNNSKFNEVDENFGFADFTKYSDIKGIYDKKFHSFDVDDALDMSKLMLDVVNDEKCVPTSGSFSTGFNESTILNSNGVECLNKSTYCGAYIAVNAESGDIKSTAYDSKTSSMMDIDVESFVKNACSLAKDSLGGETIKTKKMDVVLDYHAATGLLGTFIAAFNADNVQRGRSVFSNKLGEKITSSNLSIYDDSILEYGLNSCKCDGEGVKSEKTSLIEEGILKGFIYDIYTANKSNVSSTGNGLRSSFSDTPSPSVTNIILDFDNLVDLSEIDNGIIATDVLGAHTANPISGDFSVEVNNGFIVKNGEIIKPIKKAMLSSNIFDSFKSVEGINSSIYQYGPFVLPKLLIHDVNVIGN